MALGETTKYRKKLFRLETAEEWELYTSMKGAEGVASQITEILKNEIRLHVNNLILDPKYTIHDLVNDIYERMENGIMYDYREFGAVDTEPRAVLRDWLEIKFGVRPEW